jgi:hypothetical protein
MLLRLSPVSDTCSGMPCPSVIGWCFEPVRARSIGLGSVLGRLSWPAGASRGSPPATSSVRRRRAVRPAGSRVVGSRLWRRSSPAGVASRSCPSRTPVPGGKNLPGNAGVEDEQDAAQHFPVVQALATRVVGASGHDRRQRLDTCTSSSDTIGVTVPAAHRRFSEWTMAGL